MSSVLATFTNSGISLPLIHITICAELINSLGYSTTLDDLGSRLSRELPQEPAHRIVKVIHHALLQRNDGVVGDVNVFGANLRTALGDIAETYAELILEQLRPVRCVERMHL